MTDRLTPVGSCGGAEAILVGMSVQVTHDDVIGDVAGCRREVAPLPEALPPVALANMFEFLLDFARGPTLGPAHEVTRGIPGTQYLISAKAALWRREMSIVSPEFSQNSSLPRIPTHAPATGTNPAPKVHLVVRPSWPPSRCGPGDAASRRHRKGRSSKTPKWPVRGPRRKRGTPRRSY